MRSSHAAWFLLVILHAGCGAGTSEDLLEERFEAPEAHAARQRAPDLFAQARRARGEAVAAKSAGDEEAFADHATRARLLLAAAIAEADRATFEDRRLALDGQAQRAVAAARRDEAARAEIESETRRVLAAKVATEQARQAFGLATENEQRLHARNAAERERLHRDAAAHLLRRAKLLLSAARAMNADASSIATVEARIRQAESTRGATEAIAAADAAWREASALLGSVRARNAQPTADQLRALRDTAGEAGLEVEVSEGGLAFSVLGLFRGDTVRLGADERTRVERLAAILRAHPQGPVHIAARAPALPPARRVAERRAQVLRDALVERGIDASRLVMDAIETAREATEPRLDLVLTAYGVAAAN